MEIENDKNEPNIYVTIAGFDQLAEHSRQLAKLITEYYKNLKFNEPELKRGLVLNYQTILLSMGIMDIGQPTEFDEDDFDDELQ